MTRAKWSRAASAISPSHNARFAISAEDAGFAFVPFAGDLADILCIQDERVVGNDVRMKLPSL